MAGQNYVNVPVGMNRPAMLDEVNAVRAELSMLREEVAQMQVTLAAQEARWEDLRAWVAQHDAAANSEQG